MLDIAQATNTQGEAGGIINQPKVKVVRSDDLTAPPDLIQGRDFD